MEGRCRRFRWPPFFSEVGIDSLAKPRLFVSPTEAFRDEDLADAAALHANPFDTVQVVHQPIQRPAGVVLSQIARVAERCLNDAADFLGRVSHGSTGARRFFQPSQSLLIEAMEPIAHHVFTDLQLLGNLGRLASLAGQPDDLCAFEFPNRRVSRMHQSLKHLVFFLGYFSQSQHHLTSLVACFFFSFLKEYHIWLMHHLVVHPPSSGHFWKLGNPELPARLMSPTSTPHRGMSMRVPVGRRHLAPPLRSLSRSRSVAR